MFALSGCIAIKTQATAQRVPGVITIQAVVCASDAAHSIPGYDCDPDLPGRTTAEGDNSDDAEDNTLGQVLAGFRVPVGTVAPSDFASDTQDVFFNSSPTYTAALNNVFPPPAGEQWFGYLSTPKLFDLDDASGRQTSFQPEFTLPPQADGAPFAGPFPWRLVVGLRKLADQNQAGNPVSCPTSLTAGCFDSPVTASIPNDLLAPVSDFGVLTGAKTAAGHGETATLAFPIQYKDGRGKGPQDLAISAATNLPGTSATPAVTTLHVDPETTTMVNVTVPVPPATPLGSYTVTLSAATGSPPVTRSNTATLQVVDKLAPSIRIGTPIEGARFVLGRKVLADYACTDETNGAGLSTCSGPVPSGAAIDTRSVGPKTFRVVGADNAGNTAAAVRTYRVVPRPPPPVKVAFNFFRTPSSTTFTKLVVKGIPKRSKLTAKCRPKRCSIKAFTKRNARGAVRLKSFEDKSLRPGTTIDIRVTRKGTIGAVKLVKVHADKEPSILTRCLPLGSTKPRKRC